MTEAAAVFGAERVRVWATAYRLLGSVADADDAVQTVWLRWLESAPADVESPIAWLITAVTRLCRRFLVALGRGDVPTLMAALDASAVMLSDGGGRVVAAINPIWGRDRIGRLIGGIVAKQYEALTFHDVTVNGGAGLWLRRADGSSYAVIGLGFSPDGERVTAIYALRNPDKLRRMPYTAR